MIPLCNFHGLGGRENDGQLAIPACKLFEPISTDRGVCQSFNAIPNGELIADSPFKKAFDDVFANGEGTGPDELRRVSSADTDQGLSFFVDGQTYSRGDTIGR